MLYNFLYTLNNTVTSIYVWQTYIKNNKSMISYRLQIENVETFHTLLDFNFNESMNAAGCV